MTNNNENENNNENNHNNVGEMTNNERKRK